MAANRKKKRASTKELTKKVATSGSWTVHFGQLRRTRGNPGVNRLFVVTGEKLPFEVIKEVRADLEARELGSNGVYVAHDSMGTPRYIGRGSIFSRLNSHIKAHKEELRYFSFYVMEESAHEREVETLLIRAAGPQLNFNTRKKRIDIRPGDVRDFEPGTQFYERQKKRGRTKKARTKGAK
jgi:hypothetical protein